MVSAKHGRPPVDPTAFGPTDDASLDRVPGRAFHDADDGVLIRLKPAGRAAKLPDALAVLEQDRAALGVDAIDPAAAIASLFADPATDSRARGVLLGTDPGVVFTPGETIAEHGGVNRDGRDVALVASGPGVKPAVVDGAIA